MPDSRIVLRPYQISALEQLRAHILARAPRLRLELAPTAAARELLEHLRRR